MDTFTGSHFSSNGKCTSPVISPPIEYDVVVESDRHEEPFTEEIIEIKNIIETEKKIVFCHRRLDSIAVRNIRMAVQSVSTRHLREVKLRNCELSNKDLNELLDSDVEVTVETLNLSANKDLDMATVRNACKLMQTKNLDLSDINMSEEQVIELSNFTGIKTLELRANTFSGESVGSSLATLINHGLETLVLDDSVLSGEDLQRIGRQMSRQNNLTGLDLSHITLDEIGVKALCEIVRKAKVMEWLHLHDCGLDKTQLNMFESGFVTERSVPKVKRLKLSANPRVKDSIKTVAKIIDKLQCEDVDISRNSLRGKDFAKLATESAPDKLCTIHIRENPVGDWDAFGTLVRKWKLKKVDASECRMYLQNAKEFAKSLEIHKLIELNVRHADRDQEFVSKIHSSLNRVAEKVIV